MDKWISSFLLLLSFINAVCCFAMWHNQIGDSQMVMSCSAINADFQRGKNVFANDDAKGEYLVRNGYTSPLHEPFADMFDRLPLERNMSREFYKINSELVGVQIIVDNFAKFTRPTSPADRVELSAYLSQASNCVSHCNRDTNRIACNPSYKYRTLEGTCNNLKNPLIGAVLTPFSRLLPANYDDDVMELRKAFMGGELRSPRMIVEGLFGPPRLMPPVPQRNLPNMAFYMFGQLITHDIGGQINVDHRRPDTIDPLRCCSADFSKTLPKSLSHWGCAPFAIQRNDSYYGPQGIGCHNYVRSQPISPVDCKLSAAQQGNRVTGFIDLSNIYGSTLQRSLFLRTMRRGMLRTNRKKVLPMREGCTTTDCYYTGDARVNQTPQLAIMHSLFVRLHNQIAKTLSKINAHWDDETLFQEARRINIALLQHLIYGEYMEVLAGDRYEDTEDYVDTVSGTTTNEFTTAVFRYLHAFLPANFETYDKNGNLNGEFPVSSVIDDTRILEKQYDDVARGLLFQGINLEDPYNHEVRNRLFSDSDLISVDIQRGRDHGLNPYWRYRDMCHLPPVRDFNDLLVDISPEDVEGLRSVYQSPLDIDLYIAGGIERKVFGLFGPTFNCLTRIQFRQYKAGDRFFYTHRNTINPFTPAQLNEIRQFTFAQFVCLTTKIDRVPMYGFLTPTNENFLVKCSKLRKLDLLPWIDH